MVFDHDYANYPELTNKELETMRFSSPHEQITNNFSATIVKVHDGDTVTLRTDFRDFDFPLRFLDVDAPELSEGGAEAREWLKNKIEGQTVEVIIDPYNRVGKYGRLLGAPFYNGMNVAIEMLHLGIVLPFGKKKEAEVPNVDKTFSMKQWF